MLLATLPSHFCHSAPSLSCHSGSPLTAFHGTHLVASGQMKRVCKFCLFLVRGNPKGRLSHWGLQNRPQRMEVSAPICVWERTDG